MKQLRKIGNFTMDSSPSKEEIFEINDFTNATPWETFIAEIEKVLCQWGLATATDGPMPDLLSRQHCKAEHLSYAGRRFSMKLEVSGESDDHAHLDDERAWPTALSEMMDGKNDFPPRTHPITRWYGVKEFVLIMPEKGSESLTSQAQAKLMLSSVSIAVANTQCVTPIFIQLQQQWRHLYVGVCVGGGILTNFNMVHLKHAPPHLANLTGVIDMFKGRIGTPRKSLDAVQVAIRYTYVLKNWSFDDWPVEPLGDITGDEGMSFWKELPIGPLSDPVSELHMSAMWPNLSEETVMSHDTQSDLLPTQAPLWAVTAHLMENTNCSLSECLQNFLKLCYHEETLEQLLKTSTTDDNSYGQQPFSHALEKLTSQAVPSLGSPFLTSVAYSASQRLEFGLRGKDRKAISDKIMRDILKVLFPDVYDLPEDPLTSGEYEGKLKSAPRGSLARQLASTLCVVNNAHGLKALAEVWNEVIQELRYRWDKGILINRLPEGSPDMGSCLLHQKLQMLNCCIKHKKLQEEKLNTPNVKTRTHSKTTPTHSSTSPSHSNTSLTGLDSNTSLKSHTHSDMDSDDEFYEALETQDSNKSLAEDTNTTQPEVESDSGTKLCPADVELDEDRVGALRQCGDLVLVHTGTPLCIPVTQDHTPMTEDMMWEQQTVLAKLGTSEQAAKVRAKMQSTSLLSDMEAFKAANPGCILEDFVRWYSPRDWIESEGEDSPTPSLTATSEVCVASEAAGGVAGGVAPENDESDEKEAGSDQKEAGSDQKEAGSDQKEAGSDQKEAGSDQKEAGSDQKEAGSDQKAEGPDQKEAGSPHPPEEEEGWGGEGWGADDWDVVVSEAERVGGASPAEGGVAEGVAKRFVKGHLSERMLHADNVWMETWQSATPLPAYRQRRLFDDTKEAEKVLHFFTNLSPCELALHLMSMLLHSALERVEGRARQQPNAKVTGIVSDVVSLLATVQQPSLDSLPLYQECIGLLSQAERLLAAGQSLRTKLLRGYELGHKDMGGGGGAASLSPLVRSEVAVGTEVMLEGPELVIKEPLKSSVGVAMRGLLATQTPMQDLEHITSSPSGKFRPPPSTSFPPATWREYILRVSAPCPAPHSRICPQRMFCVLQPRSEFRVAGAFSKDTNLS